MPRLTINIVDFMRPQNMQQILKLCLETTVQWDIDTRKKRIVLALQNWLSLIRQILVWEWANCCSLQNRQKLSIKRCCFASLSLGLSDTRMMLFRRSLPYCDWMECRQTLTFAFLLFDILTKKQKTTHSEGFTPLRKWLCI